MVLESDLLREGEEGYELTGPLPALAIPATLQDLLTARLDRLTTGKAVAQLAATLGRQFSYALVQAVWGADEPTLQEELAGLLAAELLYQRGIPPETTYTFKHALIQDAAYQSLLKSTRQQYHQRIAQVLEAQFPEVAATQPEILAQHYREAGLHEQAVPYWYRAGQQALARSAPVEAMQHLTAALTLLATFPDTPARDQQELDLQLALGPALMAIKGQSSPEVEQTYARAQLLCTRVGETPQLFPTVWGLWRFYNGRGGKALSTAWELGEQLVRLAQSGVDPTYQLEAHEALGQTLFHMGDYVTAQTHLAQGIALTDPVTQQELALRCGVAPGVVCLGYMANVLWYLGFPRQAVQHAHEALTLASSLRHPYSLAMAQFWAAMLYRHRRDPVAVQTQAEALLTLSTTHGFPLHVGSGTISAYLNI